MPADLTEASDRELLRRRHEALTVANASSSSSPKRDDAYDEIRSINLELARRRNRHAAAGTAADDELWRRGHLSG